MARPGYGQDGPDYTNDGPYGGTTPDPYGTTRQTTQPIAAPQPYQPPSTGGSPGSPAYANGGTTPITYAPGTTLGGATPPPHGALTGPADGNWQQWFSNLVQGQPSSYAAIKQLEPQLANAGVKVNYNAAGDPSKLILPNGHYISVVDQNGAWRWMDQGTAADNQANQAASAQTSPFLDTFRQGLLTRLQQLQAPTDPNSPSIAQPTAAYNLQADRGLAKTKQAQAQAAYAGGSLNTGGYQQAQTQADEQAAADKANFSGNLVNTAEQSRQSQLNQLLGLGSNQGTTEELAGGQLGYNYTALKAQMDRDAILAALGGYGG